MKLSPTKSRRGCGLFLKILFRFNWKFLLKVQQLIPNVGNWQIPWDPGSGWRSQIHGSHKIGVGIRGSHKIGVESRGFGWMQKQNLGQVNNIPGKGKLQMDVDPFPGIEFPGIPSILGAAPRNVLNIHGTFSVLRTACYGWMLWTL